MTAGGPRAGIDADIPTAMTHAASSHDPQGPVDHLDLVRFSQIVRLFEDLPGGPRDCILVPFLGMLDLQFRCLDSARAAQDLAGIQEATHTIKGGSWDLGFTALGHCAERLEHEAKVGLPPSPIAWQAFLEETAWIRSYIAAWPQG